MNIKRPRAIPGSSALPGRLAISVCLLAIGAITLAGCGAKGAASSSAASGSPVIVGTADNSLPAIPAQTKVNTYVDTGTFIWNLSQPNQTFYYLLGSTENSENAGIFSSVGDFEFLAGDLGVPPYGFSGLSVEIPSGVSLLATGTGVINDAAPYVGVPIPATGCLAPNGTVTIDFLQTSFGAASPTVATDSLYASAGLNYKDGTFSYSNAQQFAVGGATASTNAIPFLDSYCVQTISGYGIQSKSVPISTTISKSLFFFLGSSGVVVGSDILGQEAGGPLIGFVEPSAPIDLASVTAGSYRGFYYDSTIAQYPDPAYFGTASAWVTSPALTQTGSSLVGGYVDTYTFQFTYPPTPVTGSILIDFGTQDSSHPGLFPSATITEPSTASCPASDLSTGSGGATYCTFPVAALIGKSYGKYAIFISGPELTTGSPLFYGLLQD